MFRLTLVLCVALYAIYIIVPDGTEPAEIATDTLAARSISDPAPQLLRVAPEIPRTLTTADGQVLQIASIIDPATLVQDKDSVTAVSTQAAESVEPAVVASLPLLRVTGNRVNLRAGPSTNNPVIGTMTSGQEAELLASLDSGWAHIRAVSTGAEGYMSGDFLAPAN